MILTLPNEEFYVMPKRYRNLIKMELTIDTNAIDASTKTRVKNALKRGHYSASRKGRIGVVVRAICGTYNLPFIFQTRGDSYGGMMIFGSKNDALIEFEARAVALLAMGGGELQKHTYSRFDGEWWYCTRIGPTGGDKTVAQQRKAREELSIHCYKVFQAVRKQYEKELMSKELKQKLKEIADQL